ncbi:MAG: 1-(5-phosphoribosyl)-5-[(5-phosphoribosylamino)methylideneamino] imidazole-4-carboxamide isomerase [Sphaerochaetaceae bacterium]|nr:1-(5-phosphoribosyl)-5-[(5-phosphoribosylamino)methylideneamino] imidazole-4-carboxamide isomerase [Spirochaetales bacterium]MDY5500404.1 1-(5-phosphoribosyl)-5-[(5-phosphoribosylamino)methylideneamino] imidazole-4-carboxamide isomerase [Sphaerochaetaceae bacterium]
MSMQCIPAIDLVGGTCVRLVQGDYGKSKQYGLPLEIAKRYEAAGFKRLHLVDLDGAKGGRIENLKVLESICSQTHLVVDFGGGIKDEANLREALDAGAQMVTCGSIAVQDRNTVLSWAKKYGAGHLIIGCDSKDGRIATNGWKVVTDTNVEELCSFYLGHGLDLFLSTDIARDGMLGGPSITLYEHLMKRFPTARFIASGGVSSLGDIRALQKAGLYGVVVGKALLEGRFTPEELKEVEDAG